MSLKIGSQFDPHPDHFRFRRTHSGAPPVPAPPLRPILRDAALAAGLLAAGGWLVVRAPAAEVAVCGLVVAAGGLFLAWWVGDQIATECGKSPLTPPQEPSYKGASLASALTPSGARRRHGGDAPQPSPPPSHPGATDA